MCDVSGLRKPAAAEKAVSTILIELRLRSMPAAFLGLLHTAVNTIAGGGSCWRCHYMALPSG